MKNKKSQKEPVPIVVNVLKFVKKSSEGFSLFGLCLTKILNKNEQFKSNKVSIDTGAKAGIGEVSFLLNKGIPLIKRWSINFYKISFKFSELVNLDIQNKIRINYDDKYEGRMLYNAFDLFTGKYRTSKLMKYAGKTIYCRQTIHNTLYITVREESTYDNTSGKFKVLAALISSKFKSGKDSILMYEKECSKYEESAAVLYEKLIDLGYKNVYFILNADNEALREMPEKYRKNIIEKDSFKHLQLFFACRKFVGTETIGHAIELRSANKYITRKVNSKKLSYVFLQHGVMYMISLDADLRTGFRQQDLNLYRVVASSQLEAKHFIELGGFQEKELYVTGLAKFDRSYRNDTADKIVIMPTWRRWESNLAQLDFEATKYYKMMERIVDTIPEALHDKVIVLPHPLMKKSMDKSDCKLKSYMTEINSYDEVLRDCNMLITDYSSIAYDAFYRGSNVIFYWEEKDECLEQYGGEAKLMINEGNVFGEVCYNTGELASVFHKNYMGKQTLEHIDKYKKIVEFDDNKNSERIIELMKKDGFLD